MDVRFDVSSFRTRNGHVARLAHFALSVVRDAHSPGESALPSGRVGTVAEVFTLWQYAQEQIPDALGEQPPFRRMYPRKRPNYVAAVTQKVVLVLGYGRVTVI